MVLEVTKDGQTIRLYIAGRVNASRQAQSYRQRGYIVITMVCDNV